MATRVQIHDVRLLINDPPGFVDIEDVASLGSLPLEPGQDTCYYLTDKARYVATDKETGAVPGDYETQRLRISDERLGSLIDELGADKARCRALRLIATKLGADMQLESTSMGGDQSRYTSLKEMYAYYRLLADDCETEINEDASNATGRIGHTDDPEIAGGLV